MIDVFIEVSKGSDRKSKYDENTFEFIKSVEMLRPYPYPYGFIIGTKGDDEEAVDAFIITEKRLEPGSKVQCELVGILLYFPVKTCRSTTESTRSLKILSTPFLPGFRRYRCVWGRSSRKRQH